MLIDGDQEVVFLNRHRDPRWTAPQFDLALPLEAIPLEPEVVYVVAAHIPRHGADSFSPALIDANVRLVADLAKRFSGSRFVYCSSVSVYGQTGQERLAEDAPFVRPGPYGLSKLAGETIVQSVPNHCILRFSSLYGAGMTARTFVPAIVAGALQDRRIRLFGDGSRQQNYLHVDDAARFLAKAGAVDITGIFNAVAARSWSNREVADIVAEIVGGVEIDYAGEDPTPSSHYDDTRWRRAVDWLPTVTMREGLTDMVRNA
jgi:nucleoside-diphosphate-sugar epimerase